MVKAEYFCDRCGANVGSSPYGLHAVNVNIPQRNPIRVDVCGICAREIAAFVAREKSEA